MKPGMGKRAVVTGLGIISPIGNGIDSFWKAAISGKSGIKPITKFDTSEYKVHIAGEASPFQPVGSESAKSPSVLGEQARFVLGATEMAITDAGLDLDDFDPSRTAVVIGNLYGEPRLLERHVQTAVEGGMDSLDPQMSFTYPYTGLSYLISSKYGFTGPSETVFAACSSGNMAIARACDLIEMDIADCVVAGGVESISRAVFSHFHELRLLAPDFCRPFDIARKGLVVAEGAGILIIQSLQSALSQKRKIHAEIAGYGLTCDAYHPSSPDPAGTGILSAMRTALERARLGPDDIDYISAHGTGTKMNDKIETAAVKKLFGFRKDLGMSSIKSMTGHCMGASSAIEAIVCCLALKYNAVPPTINYQSPDPDCDLNYVPNEAIEMPIDICMNNSLGFGGINASLIIKSLG